MEYLFDEDQNISKKYTSEENQSINAALNDEPENKLIVRNESNQALNDLSKKKKITFSASEKGLEKAEKALVRLGFESKSKFAESQLLSRSTVTKFFNQQPIQLDSFKRICEALTLNWEEIAGIGEESITSSQLERQINPSLGLEKEVGTVQTSVRQVIAVDERSQHDRDRHLLCGGFQQPVQLQPPVPATEGHAAQPVPRAA